jgi:hypothetical protein
MPTGARGSSSASMWWHTGLRAELVERLKRLRISRTVPQPCRSQTLLSARDCVISPQGPGVCPLSAARQPIRPRPAVPPHCARRRSPERRAGRRPMLGRSRAPRRHDARQALTMRPRENCPPWRPFLQSRRCLGPTVARATGHPISCAWWDLLARSPLCWSDPGSVFGRTPVSLG